MMNLRYNSSLIHCLCSLIYLFLIAGCADTKPQRRYVWPSPPNEPKIEWLGAYESQLDFPRTTFMEVTQFFIGNDPPILFKKPIDIKSNGKGKVYVLDQAFESVFVYDFNAKEVTLIDRYRSGINVNKLAGLAVAGDGTLYLLDGGAKKLLLFDKEGQFLSEINLRNILNRPVSLTYDRLHDRILVSDVGDHRIVVLGKDGAHLFSFGRPGSGDGDFSYPIATAVSSNGDIAVADVMNARIQVFDANGNFIRKFGQRGDGISDFQVIKGVAVDSDYNIYVTEGRSSRILIFSQHGQFLFTLGGQYFTANTGKAAPGGFMLPQGIDIDQQDTIYVVDQLNQRFQVFQYLKNRK